ncbi:YqjK family protein [Aquabacterium sp.]|uniref:YqjK family protein n=1 Tax=Aquabacterium sp. TaxID=1872578 RepID=UPI003D6CFE59
MSATRLQMLESKKQILQQRSAGLRQTLAQQSDRTLRPAFAVADRVNAARRWLSAHPEVIAGLALLLFRRRTKGWLAWGRRAIWLWSAWRRVQPLLGGKAKT